jgi:hypothetical protein
VATDLPSSKPAAASSNAPVQMEPMRSALGGLFPEPLQQLAILHEVA